MSGIECNKQVGVFFAPSHLVIRAGEHASHDLNSEGSSQERTFVESQLAAEAVIENLVEELCYFEDPKHASSPSLELDVSGKSIGEGSPTGGLDSGEREDKISLRLTVGQGEGGCDRNDDDDALVLLEFAHGGLHQESSASMNSEKKSCHKELNIFLKDELQGEQRPTGSATAKKKGRDAGGDSDSAPCPKHNSDQCGAIEEGDGMKEVDFVEKDCCKGTTGSDADKENECKNRRVDASRSFTAVLSNGAVGTVKEGKSWGECLENSPRGGCGLSNDASGEKEDVDVLRKNEGGVFGSQIAKDCVMVSDGKTCNKFIAASGSSVDEEMRRCFVRAFARFVVQGHPQSVHTGRQQLMHAQKEGCVGESVDTLEKHTTKESTNTNKDEHDELMIGQQQTPSNIFSSKVSASDFGSLDCSGVGSPEVGSVIVESSKSYEGTMQGMGEKSASKDALHNNAPSIVVSSNVNNTTESVGGSVAGSAFSSPAPQRLAFKTPYKTVRSETYAEVVAKGGVGRSGDALFLDIETEVREVLVQQLKALAAAFMSDKNGEADPKWTKQSWRESGLCQEQGAESDVVTISKGRWTIEKKREPGDGGSTVEQGGVVGGSWECRSEPFEQNGEEKSEGEMGGGGDDADTSCVKEDDVEWEQCTKVRCEPRFEWGDSEGSSTGSQHEGDFVGGAPSEHSSTGNCLKKDVGVQAEDDEVSNALASQDESDPGVPMVSAAIQTQASPDQAHDKCAKMREDPALGVPLFQASTLSHWPTYCSLFLGGLPRRPVVACEAGTFDRWAGNREAQERQLRFARKCQSVMREEYIDSLQAGEACYY